MRHELPGRCPGLAYDAPSGLFNVSTVRTRDRPRLRGCSMFPPIRQFPRIRHATDPARPPILSRTPQLGECNNTLDTAVYASVSMDLHPRAISHTPISTHRLPTAALSMTLDLISSSTADASFCELDSDAVVLAPDMDDVSHDALEYGTIFENLKTNR